MESWRLGERKAELFAAMRVLTVTLVTEKQTSLTLLTVTLITERQTSLTLLTVTLVTERQTSLTLLTITLVTERQMSWQSSSCVQSRNYLNHPLFTEFRTGQLVSQSSAPVKTGSMEGSVHF